MRQALTSFAVWLLSLCAVAQTDTITSRTHHLGGVTVAGHRVSRQVMESKPIQLMTHDEIELLGLQNLSDVVKRFAGASIRDYGGIGGMKTVSVRNLGAHHTAVSYDGVTISNTQAGQIDISRYSTDNVQSVSLAIGDNVDLMQTARHYASAVVLSIVTERPQFDKKDYSLQARIKGGSFGMVSPSLRYGQRLGQRTTLMLDGSYMRTDGNYPFTLTNGILKTTEHRNNSDVYAWRAEANVFHTFRDSSLLQSKTCWYYSGRGLPGAVILYNNISNERFWEEDLFTQLSYQRMLAPKWELKTHMKYTHSWNRYVDTDVKYAGGQQVDVNRQDEYYASAILGWRPVKGFSLALAEDVSYNTLRNNINTGSNQEPAQPKRFTSLTSLSLRYRYQRLLIDGNIVGTYATEKVNVGRKPEDRKRLSPSVSFSYRLLDDESLYLRAMYKSTFRLPTFNDLYYLRMGNTGLRPEKAHEYNVGITWSGRPMKAVSYISITLDGYFNDVDDKIVAFPSTYVWKMANFGKVHIWGLDATIATEVPLHDDISVALTAAYTIQKATDKKDGSPTYGQQLPYTPKHSGNVSVLVRNPWLNIGYSVLAQGRRWSSAQNTPEYEMKAFYEHSLTLSHEFRMKDCRLNLQGMIQNLTDEQYDIIKYYPMPGRTWILTGTIYI